MVNYSSEPVPAQEPSEPLTSKEHIFGMLFLKGLSNVLMVRILRPAEGASSRHVVIEVVIWPVRGPQDFRGFLLQR